MSIVRGGHGRVHLDREFHGEGGRRHGQRVPFESERVIHRGRIVLTADDGRDDFPRSLQILVAFRGVGPDQGGGGAGRPLGRRSGCARGMTPPFCEKNGAIPASPGRRRGGFEGRGFRARKAPLVGTTRHAQKRRRDMPGPLSRWKTLPPLWPPRGRQGSSHRPSIPGNHTAISPKRDDGRSAVRQAEIVREQRVAGDGFADVARHLVHGAPARCAAACRSA